MSAQTTLTDAVIRPLVDGERLDRETFERLYDAMPHVKKAELIDGVVHMPSPVRWNAHASPHITVATWLGNYQEVTPGVQAGDNGSVRLDTGDMPQPDAAMIILPDCGGRAQVSADDYLEGSPELLVEVAASSASFDMNTRLRMYERNGVGEYVVWRVLLNRVDWFVRDGEHFAPLAPSADGCFHSPTFPGLYLDPAALARHDLAAVMAALRRGLASDEHTAFVERLRYAREATLTPARP